MSDRRYISRKAKIGEKITVPNMVIKSEYVIAEIQDKLAYIDAFANDVKNAPRVIVETEDGGGPFLLKDYIILLSVFPICVREYSSDTGEIYHHPWYHIGDWNRVPFVHVPYNSVSNYSTFALYILNNYYLKGSYTDAYLEFPSYTNSRFYNISDPRRWCEIEGRMKDVYLTDSKSKNIVLASVKLDIQTKGFKIIKFNNVKVVIPNWASIDIAFSNESTKFLILYAQSSPNMWFANADRSTAWLNQFMKVVFATNSPIGRANQGDSEILKQFSIFEDNIQLLKDAMRWVFPLLVVSENYNQITSIPEYSEYKAYCLSLGRGDTINKFVGQNEVSDTINNEFLNRFLGFGHAIMNYNRKNPNISKYNINQPNTNQTSLLQHFNLQGLEFDFLISGNLRIIIFPEDVYKEMKNALSLLINMRNSQRGFSGE